jgi:hypothetical protein
MASTAMEILTDVYDFTLLAYVGSPVCLDSVVNSIWTEATSANETQVLNDACLQANQHKPHFGNNVVRYLLYSPCNVPSVVRQSKLCIKSIDDNMTDFLRFT